MRARCSANSQWSLEACWARMNTRRALPMPWSAASSPMATIPSKANRYRTQRACPQKRRYTPRSTPKSMDTLLRAAKVTMYARAPPISTVLIPTGEPCFALEPLALAMELKSSSSTPDRANVIPRESSLRQVSKKSHSTCRESGPRSGETSPVCASWNVPYSSRSTWRRNPFTVVWSPHECTLPRLLATGRYTYGLSPASALRESSSRGLGRHSRGRPVAMTHSANGPTKSADVCWLERASPDEKATAQAVPRPIRFACSTQA
mmetsp:Transcript_501/g.1315  ORF Transcript_501/g.1315 Transcript_501/m.1315 type:complete len:263 (+) Transcript_501:1145-1933(+)